MITIKAPLKTAEFQVVDFGTITYEYPSSFTTNQIDEIIVANVSDGDPSSIDFIKRYNTWFAYTQMEGYALNPYSIIFIHYDRVNQIAYTHTDKLKIIRKP
jgi:hypothetical protein